ncbi:MAG: dipeptidase, partial [Gammaproteobacteria bacterium]
IEKRFNTVTLSSPYRADAQVSALHKNLFIVDLHADPLLWGRDLTTPSTIGHVDIPRLQSGHVGLQVFGVVTKSPRGLNNRRNTGDSDLITPLAVAQAWPPRTWVSPLERALYQADRLRRFGEDSNGQLRLITSTRELDALVAARRGGGPVGAMLGLEGAHALEGDIDNLEKLHAAGFRMIGLAHFFDNEAAGSAHGVRKGGLTPLGRELIHKAQALHMIVDLAHASERTIDDVLIIASQPVVVSHTGVRGTCNNRRNLSDKHIRRIAANGGLIGIGLWRVAVCGGELRHTARAMRYVRDLVGIEHVALGSDFNGAVRTPVDVTGLVLLTQALREVGLERNEISLVMGGNALRVFARILADD